MKPEKRFGRKINELLEVIKTTDNWEEYVSDQTVEIINTLQAKNNIVEVLDELDLKYTTAHAHLIRALKRIKSKDMDFLRDGKSLNAQHLFDLTKTPNWQNCLTDKEILIVNSFVKHKNFYTCGRELKIAPSNIASILYGNTQKKGVIKKIESIMNRDGDIPVANSFTIEIKN